MYPEIPSQASHFFILCHTKLEGYTLVVVLILQFMSHLLALTPFQLMQKPLTVFHVSSGTHLKPSSPCLFCSGQQRTQFSHIWSPITRYSRVHMVLKGQDDRVERCFKSTFCNGLDCILKEREWSQR